MGRGTQIRPGDLVVSSFLPPRPDPEDGATSHPGKPRFKTEQGGGAAPRTMRRPLSATARTTPSRHHRSPSPSPRPSVPTPTRKTIFNSDGVISPLPSDVRGVVLPGSFGVGRRASSQQHRRRRHASGSGTPTTPIRTPRTSKRPASAPQSRSHRRKHTSDASPRVQEQVEHRRRLGRANHSHSFDRDGDPDSERDRHDHHHHDDDVRRGRPQSAPVSRGVASDIRAGRTPSKRRGLVEQIRRAEITWISPPLHVNRNDDSGCGGGGARKGTVPCRSFVRTVLRIINFVAFWDNEQRASNS